MPYTPIGSFKSNLGVQRSHEFKRPVTFYDRVRFVGPDSSILIVGGVFSGDLFSSTWDGTIPLDLSSIDVGATVGYALDDSEGAAQFQTIFAEGGTIGDLTVTGTLTGGTFLGGDIYSSTWDGTIPLDLSSKDAGATAGYALDDSEGTAQFQTIFAEGGTLGDLDVLGALTLGTNGILRSAASGLRWETDVDPQAEWRFYTGDDDETGPALVRLLTFDGGPHALWITAPGMANDDAGVYINAKTFVQLNQGGSNVSVAGGGVSLQAETGGIMLICDTALKQVQFGEGNLLAGAQGSAAKPLLTTFNDTDTGMYWSNNNALAFTCAGTQVLDMIATGIYPKKAIRHINGTDSAPSYAFSSSASSGMKWSAGYVKIQEGGATVISGNGSSEVYLGGMASGAGAGDVRYSGSQIYFLASSKRFKKSIKAETFDEDRLSLIDGWKSSSFVYKDSPDTARHLYSIAEDVQASLGDEYTTYYEGEIHNIERDAVITLLVENVKDLRSRTRLLEAQVEALTEQVKSVILHTTQET